MDDIQRALYLSLFSGHLARQGVPVVENALSALGFLFDTTCPSGSVSACSRESPWYVHATPGWDEAGMDANGDTIVPVQITDVDGAFHPRLSHIDGFRLRLTGDLERDTLAYSEALARIVREVVMDGIRQPSVVR